MTVRKNVETILAHFEEARNDDKFLMAVYWRQIDKVDFGNFAAEFLSKATAPESIRRARQLIQEEGLYLPTDDVVLARRFKEYRMKDAVAKREVI